MEQYKRKFEENKVDKNLVNSFLKLDKHSGKEIAEIIYDSMKAAFNRKSFGSDNEDYSGALWDAVVSALQKLV